MDNVIGSYKEFIILEREALNEFESKVTALMTEGQHDHNVEQIRKAKIMRECIDFNLGIDFAPMTITGVKKGMNIDETLIDLKALCIRLDNRYIKDYKILRNETMTVIEIDV